MCRRTRIFSPLKEFSSGTGESILELVLMTSDIEAAAGLGVQAE